MANNTTLKARLILYNRGKILLLKQQKKNGGNYSLVGGTIEDNETAKESLIRESLEEAGIVLKKENLELAHVLHKQTKKGQRVTFYFKTSRWEGNLRSREPEKFQGVEWFHLYNLPKNLTGTVRHVMRQYRKGKVYSAFNEKKAKPEVEY
ncbi:MAG: 8-oxo-dGTP diphosphatase [Paraglaciecola sp.]|jgi:8-oxo-dGTP diphosphatase